MAAPQLINAFYHFPAWIVMVGQSIIWATVTIPSSSDSGGGGDGGGPPPFTVFIT